jgi:hypothetical protein
MAAMKARIGLSRYSQGLTQTHGKETIIVNQVIRDGRSKGSMQNREPIMSQIFQKIFKPIYRRTYLRGFGFDTFVTNLLVISSEALPIFFILLLTYVSEVSIPLILVSMIEQIWILPSWSIYVWLKLTAYKRLFDAIYGNHEG